MNSDEKSLYAGLQALSDMAFPKQCLSCGRQYGSAEAFIAESRALNGSSGLKVSLDDDDLPVVELFRNCVCGSTLMEFFNDRRGTSPGAAKRRALFATMLETLQHRGLEPEVGRQELLKLMQGQRSARLEAMGIRLAGH